MASVAKRKAAIINVTYAALILGIFYLFMKYAFWMISPFIFAFFVAMAIQKPVNFVAKKTPLKKGLVSVFLVLLIVIAFGFVLSMIGVKLTTEIKDFASYIAHKVESLSLSLTSIESSLLRVISSLPDSIEKPLASYIQKLAQTLAETSLETGEAVESAEGSGLIGGLFSNFDLSMLSTPISGFISTAKQIPSVVVAIVIGIVACCFMSSDYDRIAMFIKRQLSAKKRAALSRTKWLVFSSMGKMFKSYVTLIIITFTEMLIGLNVLRLIGVYKSGYLVSVAMVVAIVDIFPVLGTGTILIPWSIYSLLTDSIGLGIGLIVLYAVIFVVRQIIEPKLVAANLGLPSVVTIMCMYIGLQLFGFIGIFILPIVVTVTKLMNDEGIINLWKSEKSEKVLMEASGTDSPPEETPKKKTKAVQEEKHGDKK